MRHGGVVVCACACVCVCGCKCTCKCKTLKLRAQLRCRGSAERWPTKTVHSSTRPLVKTYLHSGRLGPSREPYYEDEEEDVEDV